MRSVRNVRSVRRHVRRHMSRSIGERSARDMRKVAALQCRLSTDNCRENQGGSHQLRGA